MSVCTHRNLHQSLCAKRIGQDRNFNLSTIERLPSARPWASASLLAVLILRPRLRIVVLGRAACAVGHRRGYDSYDPGVYGAVGNRFSATQTLTFRLALALLIGIGGVAVMMSRSLNLGGRRSTRWAPWL